MTGRVPVSPCVPISLRVPVRARDSRARARTRVGWGQAGTKGRRAAGGRDMKSQPTAPVPRVCLTREEPAAAIGVSLSHFGRHVQPHLRLIYSGSGPARLDARARGVGRENLDAGRNEPRTAGVGHHEHEQVGRGAAGTAPGHGPRGRTPHEQDEP